MTTGAHPDNRPAAHRWPGNDAAPHHDGAACPESSAGARFVVHVPLSAPDVTVALRVARLLAHRSATLPGVEPGGTTVSDHGEPARDHPAFCDRTLSPRHRCRLTARHDGPCRP